MVTIVRLFFALFVIILVIPQTKKYNIVLRIFHESGFFIDYREAKWFLSFLTWIVILIFLIISLL